MTKSEKDIGEIVQNCKVLLLDIEGTTTSISFVKDKLFPYAAEHVQEFLEEGWEQEAVKEAIAALRKLASEDEEQKLEGVVKIPAEDATKEEQISGIVDSVKWQMSADRKSGALKLLQGLVWQQGYDKGDIKGHVFEDVAVALQKWRRGPGEGRQVYIYSSGSVQAQKSLFKHSEAGDLLPLLDGHFDTQVGAKREPQSYNNIVEKIGCKADEVLFLTDILEEATAAVMSGLHAALVVRQGNQLQPSHTLPQITTFNQLVTTTAATTKRKPDDTEESQPAKVAKIDVSDDVKSATGPEKSKDSNASINKDDVTINVAEKTVQKEKETAPAIVISREDEMEVDDTKAEENINKHDIPEKSDEALLTRDDDGKTENVKDKTITEKIEEQTLETETIIKEVPKNTDEPTIITEIEEVTETFDTDNLERVDIIPVVEEPTELAPAPTLNIPDDAEMADILNDEGEALQKECEEILSKVRKVTEIDNITKKVSSAIPHDDLLKEKPEIIAEVTEKKEQESITVLTDSGENNSEDGIHKVPIEEQKMDTDAAVKAAPNMSDIEVENSVNISAAERSIDTTSPMESLVFESTVIEPTVEKVDEPVTLVTIVDAPVDTSQEKSEVEEKLSLAEDNTDEGNLKPEANVKLHKEERIQLCTPTVTLPVVVEADELTSLDKNNITPTIDAQVTQDETVDIEETSITHELRKLSNSSGTDQPKIDILVNGKTNGVETQTAQTTETDGFVETEIVNTVTVIETVKTKENDNSMETATTKITETEAVKTAETTDKTENCNTAEHFTETANGTVTESGRITEETNGTQKTNVSTVKANGNGDIVDVKRNGTPAQEPSRLNGTAEDESGEGVMKGKLAVGQTVAAMETEG